ncbi:hypothetical protein EB796_024253 [Bugula neritina]|uniref:Uncharacterized protein n=1 Tax=Bugula neritina TaxID=10212 RepID=A0A7J7IU36_BUGNE|nr:hypothetical protein EB796_024253 [Bugula neritina]
MAIAPLQRSRLTYMLAVLMISISNQQFSMYLVRRSFTRATSALGMTSSVCLSVSYVPLLAVSSSVQTADGKCSVCCRTARPILFDV